MYNISWSELFARLNTAFFETLLMWFTAGILSIIVGTLIGLVIFTTRDGLIWKSNTLYYSFSTFINAVRSIPFIILLIFILPFTKFLIGTTIGPFAASVSISITAVAFFARLVEMSFSDVDKGIIEASKALGASNFTIVKEVLFPEAIPSLIRGVTVLSISILGLTAMAGMFGGGGIGDLAVRYGYYRYETKVMLVTSVVLIVWVQLIQAIGDYLAKKSERK
jgi:D-methionine transport system permease protein